MRKWLNFKEELTALNKAKKKQNTKITSYPQLKMVGVEEQSQAELEKRKTKSSLVKVENQNPTEM